MDSRAKEIIATTTCLAQVVSRDFLTLNSVDITVHIVKVYDSISFGQKTIQFEYTIPKHIYDEARSLFPDVYPETFTRVRRYALVEKLLNEINEINHQIQLYHNFKNIHGDKVLFIQYKGSHSKVKKDQNYGAGMGQSSSMIFQYFVGYKFIGIEKKWDNKEVAVEKYSSYYQVSEHDGGSAEWRKKSIVPLYRTEQQLRDLKSNFIIVPYTEEREYFLRKFQTNFNDLINKVGDYLNNLDEEKLDLLVAGSQNLLPSNDSKKDI